LGDEQDKRTEHRQYRPRPRRSEDLFPRRREEVFPRRQEGGSQSWSRRVHPTARRGHHRDVGKEVHRTARERVRRRAVDQPRPGSLAGQEGDAAALALAASPHLANLEDIDPSAHRIGSDGATTLAASPHLGKLRSLNPDDNSVGGDDNPADDDDAGR
jgi:hypothetical protein